MLQLMMMMAMLIPTTAAINSCHDQNQYRTNSDVCALTAKRGRGKNSDKKINEKQNKKIIRGNCGI
jgi:hypothetical protein